MHLTSIHSIKPLFRRVSCNSIQTHVIINSHDVFYDHGISRSHKVVPVNTKTEDTENLARRQIETATTETILLIIIISTPTDRNIGFHHSAGL